MSSTMLFLWRQVKVFFSCFKLKKKQQQQQGPKTKLTKTAAAVAAARSYTLTEKLEGRVEIVAVGHAVVEDHSDGDPLDSRHADFVRHHPVDVMGPSEQYIYIHAHTPPPHAKETAGRMFTAVRMIYTIFDTMLRERCTCVQATFFCLLRVVT